MKKQFTAPDYREAGPQTPYLSRKFPLPVGHLDYLLNPHPYHLWREAALEQGEFTLLYDLPRVADEFIETDVEPEDTLKIFNLGTHRGGSAIIMAQGLQDWNLKGHIWSIDIFEECRAFAEANFKKADVENLITSMYVSSEDFAKEWNEPFNLMFIDGGHGYDTVTNDIKLWKNALAPRGIIAFHDTNQRGVDQAVKEGIEADPRFKLILWVYRTKCFLNVGAP